MITSQYYHQQMDIKDQTIELSVVKKKILYFMLDINSPHYQRKKV